MPEDHEPSPEEISAAFNDQMRDEGVSATPPNEKRKRALIKIPSDQRELVDFCDECGKILGEKDRLFRRDRLVVVINNEQARLDMLTPSAMCSFAQHYIQFFRFKVAENDEGEKETQTIIKNISADTARKLLESWDMMNHLPNIRRVNPVRLPVFFGGGYVRGRIELLPAGYSDEQGIYTVPSSIAYDETMTKAQAKEILDGLLKHFPFLNNRSRASAIAAMLTMFCANMLPRGATRPANLYIGNGPGAGKTLLAKVAVMPVAGECEARTLPGKEETRKMLDALAMDASIYSLLDNIKTRIASAELEGYITSGTWGGRVLGATEKFRVENVTTFFLTGNQTNTSDDMSERCLFIELFIEEADNRDREIPKDEVLTEADLTQPEQRSRILSALWALVRAWDAEGRPQPKRLMQRFEDWSRVVPGIVIAAGYGDPLEKPEIACGADVERRDMHTLIKLLAPDPSSEGEAGRIRVYAFGEIVDVIKSNGIFEEVEIWQGRSQKDQWDKDGNITPAGKSHFGKLLMRFNNRVFKTESGYRMKFKPEGKGDSRKYIIELV
jgi:hypothetical protein